MAQVVDVLRAARAAFGEYAERYLEIPETFYKDGVMPASAVDAVARYLIENKMISKVELDIVLDRAGIKGVAVY